MRRKNKKPKINPNRIIDQTLHPFFKEDKAFVIIDGVLHFMVEQNPPKSMKKFIKYSLRYLL